MREQGRGDHERWEYRLGLPRLGFEQWRQNPFVEAALNQIARLRSSGPEGGPGCHRLGRPTRAFYTSRDVGRPESSLP